MVQVRPQPALENRRPGVYNFGPTSTFVAKSTMSYENRVICLAWGTFLQQPADRLQSLAPVSLEQAHLDSAIA